jgi:manganese transport protein
MQLPFAIIPLIHFTNDRERMGAFANSAWVRVLAWATATIIVGLNIRLAVLTLGDWLTGGGVGRGLVWTLGVPGAGLLLFLLLWVTLEPLISRWTRRFGHAPVILPATAVERATPIYRRILVPLDHSQLDRLAVSHASSLAKLHDARLYLLHVEEGVTSQIYGPESSTAEVEAGGEYLETIAESLRQQGIAVETAVYHSSSPRREIVRYAREIGPDLVVMGAHGHGRLKDLIFGDTINPVRHHLDVPILIVRPGRS